MTNLKKSLYTSCHTNVVTMMKYEKILNKFTKYVKEIESVSGNDRVLFIPCKGDCRILPYSLDGNTLCAYVSFESGRHKGAFVRNHLNKHLNWKINQEGDYEIVFTFQSNELDLVADVLSASKVRT